jgi:CRISPR-associated exonuclease Cas4
MDPLADLAQEEEWEIPISAIEHYSYCPRQCALIHVEQTFAENQFTMRGRLVHERVDAGDSAANRGSRTVRAIPLWSTRLGLRGKADAVEFLPTGPYPVEYKLGRPRGIHADLQLCAQALCLEEMLDVAVPRGAIFYHALRKRHEVLFDAELRRRTIETIAAIRALLRAQQLPAAPNDERCRHCSLLQPCLPAVVGEPARLRGMQSTLFQPYAAGEE